MNYLTIHWLIYRWSFVLALILFFVFLRKLLRVRIFGILFWWGVLGLFVWSRWIEPNQVKVHESMLDVWFRSDVVLISDLHLGVYKGSAYLEKVVRKINELSDIDAVLIAGDVTFEPLDESVEGLSSLLWPLSDLQVPVFAVLGNHDVEKPGPALRDELVKALNLQGVIFLQNDIYQFGDIKLVWLGSHFAQEDDSTILNTVNPDENIMVLTHNPDTINRYTNLIPDITLVGHTHCGQIRIPYLQEYIRPYIYPVAGDFDCGWYPDLKLFITQWLWEVMLPIRFLSPPTVDVLRMR